MPFEWHFLFLYELRKKCPSLVCGAKRRAGHTGVPWCHGADVHGFNCPHQTVAIRQQAQTHLVLILLNEVLKWMISTQLNRNKSSRAFTKWLKTVQTVFNRVLTPWYTLSTSLRQRWKDWMLNGHVTVLGRVYWIVTGPHNWEAMHEMSRGEPNVNQTYPILNALSCVFVENIFLGGLPLLCWMPWLGFLLNSVGWCLGQKC